MSKNYRFSGCLDEINLDLVEREVTSRLLMKVSIRLHLAGLSIPNTIFVDIFDVDRVRSSVHNWIYKTDLQPESDRSPNRVAVDETVIQLDDEQYWLYTAVDPDSNDLLHTKLEPTRTSVIADQLVAEVRDKHDVDDTIFLVDSAVPIHRAYKNHGLNFSAM